MSDDVDSNQKSWLEKLSYAILREPQDREQLIELLRDAENRQLLDNNALLMIEGVLTVSQLQARDIMIPRSQMVVVELDEDPKIFLPKVTESGHSRFPIITESRDEVVGILLAKDLLNFDLHNENALANFSLQKLIRPVVFIPESKRVDILLKEFRLNHNHMAIVIDEYGGVSGLITIEDVLEQIVGNIEDEYDTEQDANISQQSEKHFFIKALTPIEEFNKYFKCELDEEEFDTIGGLVMGSLGHLPKKGETILVGRFQFKILNADTRRIKLLETTVLG